MAEPCHRVASQFTSAMASFSAAKYSPSAWMTFARRSRSASACRAIARIICSANSNLFHLNQRHLHAPRSGVLIEDRLQAEVQFAALAQQFVEFRFAQNAP